jgi:hypothetical protein
MVYTPNADPATPEANSFDYNNLMRMAPVAMNAISGLTAKKGRPLSDVNLPTISPTLISPEQLSNAPVQEAVGSQYRSNVDALSGAAGGSGAVVRSGLNSLSLAGARGAGEAYNDINNKNAMLRSDATKFNAQETSQANQVNLGQRDKEIQMNRESQIANQQDIAARDMARRTGLNSAATALGQIGKENKQSEMIQNIYKYDSQGNKIIDTTAMDSAAKAKKLAATKAANQSWKSMINRDKAGKKLGSISTTNPQSTLNNNRVGPRSIDYNVEY